MNEALHLFHFSFFHFLLIFHLFNPRRSMRMPLAHLPIRRGARPVRSRGSCLDRLGRCFLPTLTFLRFFRRLLRFLVLVIDSHQPHCPGVELKAPAKG